MRFSTKIGLSATMATLLIGPLLGVVVFLQARSVLQEHILRAQAQSATSIMREIDTAMYQAYLDVSMIAADELLRDAVEHPNRPVSIRLEEELAERERLTGPWQALAVFDQTGRALFGPKPLGEAKQIAAYPANKIGFDYALKGEIYYSEQVICPKKHRPIIIFAAPVYARDNPSKVVGVVITQYLWITIQQILDHLDPAELVHLIDHNGDVIGKQTNDKQPMQHIPPLPPSDMNTSLLSYGTVTSSHGEGDSLAVELLQTGVQDYHGSGWRLRLENPLSRAYAPITELAWNTGLLFFGMLLLTNGLLVLLGRRFIRPLAELVEGVRQVEQGRFDRKVTVHSKDEFGELAGSFNTMVEKLQTTRDELVRKEKLAMLGQVAGSVGHELRNPLGVISNAVFYLQTVLEGSDESVKEYLGIILAEITRSEYIVAELLDAVRTSPSDRATHGVAELIGQIVRQCTIAASVTVTLDIPETIPPLRVDARQMQQVFCNLISNGVEAMPEGGTLVIRAVENRQEKTVTVIVQDNGHGMAPEVLAQLFQPLYTTKARGIGLGLVVARNLIEANGGHIEVQSEPGQGTTFSIILPGDYQEGNQHAQE